jgi:hypothetical protein
MLILAAGLHPKGQTAPPSVTNEAEVHALKNLEMVRALLGDPSPKNPAKEATPVSQAEIPCSLPSTTADDQPVEQIPQEVLACNFWLLVASAGSRYASQAWFQPDGTPLPVVGALRQWLINRRLPSLSTEGQEVTLTTEAKARSGPALSRPIPHYLLLPLYAWGAADWQLEALHPFIQKYHPTVGFSLVEAALAERVTVIGGAQSFPDNALERLRATGCRVERIQGDGTSIATQLSAL